MAKQHRITRSGTSLPSPTVRWRWYSFSLARSALSPLFSTKGCFTTRHKCAPEKLGAIRLPSGVREYGGLSTLLEQLTGPFEEYLALSRAVALRVAIWVTLTWIAELLPAIPVLYIEGHSLRLGMRLFQFLRALSRRAILVSDPRLPVPLLYGPTILLFDSFLSKARRSFWRLTSYHGVYCPGPHGQVLELTCPKAVYCDGSEDSNDWYEDVIHVPLLAADHLPDITDPQLESLAQEFQPRLQHYRLSRVARGAEPQVRALAIQKSPGLVRELFAALGDEPGVAELMLPLAEPCGQGIAAQRAVDSLAVIVEVIFAASHHQRAITSTELREALNAALHARGAMGQFSAKQIGWKLRQLGLDRKRAASGTFLEFSREVRVRVHALAERFRLGLEKVQECEFCSTDK
jgi:hypothetical protein